MKKWWGKKQKRSDLSPMVARWEVANLSSQNRSRMLVLPTPESPMISNLKIQSYSVSLFFYIPGILRYAKQICYLTKVREGVLILIVCWIYFHPPISRVLLLPLQMKNTLPSKACSLVSCFQIEWFLRESQPKSLRILHRRSLVWIERLNKQFNWAT